MFKSNGSMNFAHSPKKPEVCCTPTPANSEPSYPELCLRDDAVDKFKELVGDELKMGQEVKLQVVKMKVKGMREDQYGKSIDLCLIECDGAESSEGDGDEGEEPEKKKPLKDRLKESAPARKSLKERLRYEEDEE